MRLVENLENPLARAIEPPGIDPPWSAGTWLPRCGMTLLESDEGEVRCLFGTGWSLRDWDKALSKAQVLAALDKLKETYFC